MRVHDGHERHVRREVREAAARRRRRRGEQRAPDALRHEHAAVRAARELPDGRAVAGFGARGGYAGVEERGEPVDRGGVERGGSGVREGRGVVRVVV